MKINCGKSIYFIFFIGYFLRYFTNIDQLYSLFIFILFDVLCIIYCFIVCDESWVLRFWGIVVAIDIWAAIGVAVNENHTLADIGLLLTWECFGLLLYVKRANLRIINYSFEFLKIYLLVITFFSFISSRSDLDIKITDRTTSNTIGILALQILIIEYIYANIQRKRMKYQSLLCVLIICVLSRSTMGILLASYYIVTFYLFNNRNSIRKALKWGVALIGCIYVRIKYIGYIFDFVQKGDSTTRILMWTRYYQLSIKHLKSMVFGANISNDFLLFTYKNLHNTFFNWHYYYGLLPMLFFGGIIVFLLFCLVKKKKIMTIYVVIGMIIRSITDETSYAFLPIWIFMLLCEINENKQKNCIDTQKTIA